MGRARSIPLEMSSNIGSTNSSPQSAPLNESSSSAEIINVADLAEKKVNTTVIERMSVDQRKDLTVEEVLSFEGPDTWENLSEFMRKCTIPTKRTNEPDQLEMRGALKNKKFRNSTNKKEDPSQSPASKRLKFNK